MKNKLCTLLITSLFCYCSCSKNHSEVIAKWYGKEIIFPTDVMRYVADKDTTLGFSIPLLKLEYKILLYLDSTGCTGCQLKLFEWKKIIKESDLLFNSKLSFVFMLYPKDKEMLYSLLKRNKFGYPVFIDKQNKMQKLNHFEKDNQYRCFLLDKDNRVLAIGNPVQNPKIWALYKKIIKGEIVLD